MAKASFRINQIIVYVERGKRNVGATVKNGVGVDFLFGDGGDQGWVEGHAVSEVVTFVALEAFLKLSPRQRHDVDGAFNP